MSSFSIQLFYVFREISHGTVKYSRGLNEPETSCEVGLEYETITYYVFYFKKRTKYIYLILDL